MNWVLAHAQVLDTNQARVMDLFRAWDTNEDGLLGKKELSKALGVLGIEASPKVGRIDAARAHSTAPSLYFHSYLSTAFLPQRPLSQSSFTGLL